MKINLILGFLFLGMLLSCDNSTDPNYDSFYESLTNLTAKDAIIKANEWKYSAPKITSYVTAKEVVFDFPDGRTLKKDLPKNEFYMAIAPYLDKTHSCEIHYTSSCDGEMKEKLFEITVLDENSNILMKDSKNSMKNGFFELWLPRDKTINIKIKYNSFIGEENLSTFDNSRTCITTIKLK